MNYKEMSIRDLMKLIKRCRTKAQIKYHLRRWKKENEEYLEKVRY